MQLFFSGALSPEKRLALLTDQLKQHEEKLDHLKGNMEKFSSVPPEDENDFADYLAHVPGCYAFIGSRNSQSCHTGMPHHHAQFDIDEDAMLLSLAVFVGYALQYLA